MSTLSLPIPTSATDAISLSRSHSTDDATVPTPPRYSSLTGALPANLYLSTTSNQPDNSTSQSRPPRYSAVFHKTEEAVRQSTSSRQQSREEGRSDAPSGSRSEQDSRNASCSVSPAGLHTFKYRIFSSSKNTGTPWATLKLYSQASAPASSIHTAGSPLPKVPKFNSSDLIQGSLELNLSSGQNINSISLVLRGRVMTSAYDEGICTFLEYPVTTWTRADGHPHDYATIKKKFEGKLSGDFIWPLNFRFPSEVQLNGSNQHTPPNFVDRRSMCSVEYDFVLKISQGMLRSDAKLNVNVAYAPDVMPPPSSILRQLAYGERLRAPGPDEDPTGWQTMAPIKLRGAMFNDKTVTLQCTVSLASPKSYVRGSIIPCHVSFFSLREGQAEALEALVQPSCVVMRLVRKLQYFEDGGQTVARGGSSNSSRAEAQKTKPVEDVAYVGKAVWHAPSKDDSPNSSRCRTLEGEIHLDKDLPPSCDFRLFKASYTVDLCPFDLSSLKSSSQQSLGSWPVTIASVHGEGPTPVAFTKPYRSPRKQEQPTSSLHGPSAYLLSMLPA